MIFWMRFIRGLRFRRRRATQTHITTLKLALLTLVLLVARRILLSTGANLEISELKVFQEKVLIHWGSSRLRMEFVLSEQNFLISLCTIFPMSFTTCFRTARSFIHSVAIAFLLLRATALPRCFCWGVKKNVLGLLYPTRT